MREMELNRRRDFVADEIGKSSVELEASNAACQACLEEAGNTCKMILQMIQGFIEVIIEKLSCILQFCLSHHLCAVQANRVEEDIEKASKVGKQVKWQVLDIKFGKQAKKIQKESNGEVFEVSFLSSCLFGSFFSFPVT